MSGAPGVAAEVAARHLAERWRVHRLLALVPAVALVGAPWFADTIEPRLAGLPFLLTWMVAWVILASVTMLGIGLIDARLDARLEARQPSRFDHED